MVKLIRGKSTIVDSENLNFVFCSFLSNIMFISLYYFQTLRALKFFNSELCQMERRSGAENSGMITMIMIGIPITSMVLHHLSFLNLSDFVGPQPSPSRD